MPDSLLRELTRELVLSGRLWRKMAREAASRHGVSEAASAPLIWIDRLGDHVRQNALADAVGIEGASLVRLIDELEASGLVRREPDPSDRRANVVSYTDEGRRVVGAVNEALMAVRREVFAGLPDADLDAALRVFAAIRAATTKGDDQPA
ncbi:MarR family winged helix-turn-helix transcriptional regulator [Devosia sp.]|uniref:MarR family winged helix-turn-helix transcriptional regulator n=1 Tax=Devosia sp. TaxID=1871048 RepID=UPI0035B0CB88